MFIFTHHIISSQFDQGRVEEVLQYTVSERQHEHGFFLILLHNFKVILFVYNIWKSGYANKFSTYLYTLCTKIPLEPEMQVKPVAKFTCYGSEVLCRNLKPTTLRHETCALITYVK